MNGAKISVPKKKNDAVNNNFQAKSFLSGGVNMFGTIIGGIVPMIRQVFKPLFMVIAILLLSALGITWAASFVGITYASPAIAFAGPNSSLLSYLGIGSLLLVVGIPILSIMLLISRMAFKYRVHKTVKFTYRTIWIVALVLLMGVGMTTIKDYAMSHTSTSVTDYNIENKEIIITMPEENSDHSFGVHLGNLFVNNDENWSIRDVKFKVEKSADGLVHIEKKVSSKGSDNKNAQENSILASNDLKVEGNTISISKFMHIPKGKKFRNQEIEYTIYIPEGKTVVLDDNVKESMRSSELFSHDKIYSDIENLKWDITSVGATSNLWEDVINHIKSVDITSFKKLNVNQVNIKITSGDKNKMTILGPKDQVSKVIVKQVGDLLTLDFEDNYRDAHYMIEDVVVELVIDKNVDLIQLENVDDAKIIGLNSDNLQIIASSEYYDCGLDFEGVVKNINLNLSGLIDVEFTGSAEKMKVELSDNADLIANKFMVKNMELTSDGSNHSDSKVFVSDSLKLIPENTQITILGNPKKVKVNENI